MPSRVAVFAPQRLPAVFCLCARLRLFFEASASAQCLGCRLTGFGKIIGALVIRDHVTIRLRLVAIIHLQLSASQSFFFYQIYRASSLANTLAGLVRPALLATFAMLLVVMLITPSPLSLLCTEERRRLLQGLLRWRSRRYCITFCPCLHGAGRQDFTPISCDELLVSFSGLGPTMEEVVARWNHTTVRESPSQR